LFYLPSGWLSMREKAVEGYRSPRRFAHAGTGVLRASVLDCASPLALSPRIISRSAIKDNPAQKNLVLGKNKLPT
jgi:hypothetical protein